MLVMISKPEAGLNLGLTIDARINRIMERNEYCRIDIQSRWYDCDCDESKNGEILGMSSRPSFDPADFQSVSPEVYNRNLPVWSTYERVQHLKSLR